MNLEKRIKMNEQSLQEIWDFIKRLKMGRIEISWKHTSAYYPGELPQPSKAGQHSNSGNTDITKILLEKSNPNHQIHQG